jgi:hypothetical protein
MQSLDTLTVDIQTIIHCYRLLVIFIVDSVLGFDLIRNVYIVGKRSPGVAYAPLDLLGLGSSIEYPT